MTPAIKVAAAAATQAAVEAYGFALWFVATGFLPPGVNGIEIAAKAWSDEWHDHQDADVGGFEPFLPGRLENPKAMPWHAARAWASGQAIRALRLRGVRAKTA